MEQLGIEPGLLLAQVINFIIILVVLTKLLYTPILKALEERRKKIEEGLAFAEEMKQHEAKLDEERKKMLDEARVDVRQIMDDAKKRAEAQEKDILSEARQQAADIVKKGKAEVVDLRQKMQRSVRQDAVDLAVAMTRQLLSEIISEEDQKRLITKHMKKIEHMKVQ